jgi:hypothetical protein
MIQKIQFPGLLLVTLMLVLGIVLASSSFSLAQDSKSVAIKNKKNQQDHSTSIVKRFDRDANTQVWLIYEQMKRQVVVAVVQGKDIATYTAQINTPYTDGIEVDLLRSKDSLALAGEALHLQINGNHDGLTSFITNEMQLIFPDKIFSWSAAKESDRAIIPVLP